MTRLWQQVLTARWCFAWLCGNWTTAEKQCFPKPSRPHPSSWQIEWKGHSCTKEWRCQCCQLSIVGHLPRWGHTIQVCENYHSWIKQCTTQQNPSALSRFLPSGVPPHNLCLEEAAPIVLRNSDLSQLYNGTRLDIKQILPHVLAIVRLWSWSDTTWHIQCFHMADWHVLQPSRWCTQSPYLRFLSTVAPIMLFTTNLDWMSNLFVLYK